LVREGTVLLEDAIRNEIEGNLWLGLLEGEGIGTVTYVEKAQQLYALVICLSREGSGAFARPHHLAVDLR
jgi:hypothetical protein